MATAEQSGDTATAVSYGRSTGYDDIAAGDIADGFTLARIEYYRTGGCTEGVDIFLQGNIACDRLNGHGSCSKYTCWVDCADGESAAGVHVRKAAETRGTAATGNSSHIIGGIGEGECTCAFESQLACADGPGLGYCTRRINEHIGIGGGDGSIDSHIAIEPRSSFYTGEGIDNNISGAGDGGGNEYRRTKTTIA